MRIPRRRHHVPPQSTIRFRRCLSFLSFCPFLASIVVWWSVLFNGLSFQHPQNVAFLCHVVGFPLVLILRLAHTPLANLTPFFCLPVKLFPFPLPFVRFFFFEQVPFFFWPPTVLSLTPSRLIKPPHLDPFLFPLFCYALPPPARPRSSRRVPIAALFFLPPGSVPAATRHQFFQLLP